MSAARRTVALASSVLLLGCAGGHPPLGTIQRIPGSTLEGHEIVPLDTAHVIRPLHDTGGNAAPTAGVIHPLDGRPAAAAHEIVPLDTVVVPLDSTRWSGTTIDGAITLEFLVGGILRYTTANGTYTNGTWTQLGNSVQFEMNGHYADYTGHVRGTRMSGSARNRQGRAWEWEATRQ